MGKTSGAARTRDYAWLQTWTRGRLSEAITRHVQILVELDRLLDQVTAGQVVALQLATEISTAELRGIVAGIRAMLPGPDQPAVPQPVVNPQTSAAQ